MGLMVIYSSQGKTFQDIHPYHIGSDQPKFTFSLHSYMLYSSSSVFFSQLMNLIGNYTVTIHLEYSAQDSRHLTLIDVSFQVCLILNIESSFMQILPSQLRLQTFAHLVAMPTFTPAASLAL